MNPKKLVFNTVSVGFAETKSFILSNISNCAIYVKLVIEPESQDLLNSPSHMQLINTSFTFDFKEGILAANSN
jgi:hypothetical protein